MYINNTRYVFCVTRFTTFSPAFAGLFSRFILRTPWRVLWASKLERTRSSSRGCAPSRRVAQDHTNHNFVFQFFDLLLYLHHTALQPFCLVAATCTTAAALRASSLVMAAGVASTGRAILRLSYLLNLGTKPEERCIWFRFGNAFEP